MSYASAAEIRKATADLLRPPRRVSVSEAAESYLRIATPGGFVGNWSRETFPYMVEPMDVTSSRHVTGEVFVGPAQSGKTFSLIGGRIAYGMVCDPADQLVIQMSQDSARDFSRKELDRWIRNSPEIAARLSTRARDDNTYDKFWRNGAVLKIGWPAISQVSSKSVRDAMATDYDRMPQDIDGDGALFGLLDQRIKTWGSRGIVLVESSPGYDIEPEHSKWIRKPGSNEAPPVGGILGLYNIGDRCRWWWPCPHCGEYFEAEPGIGLFGIPAYEELREMLKSYSVGQLVARYAMPIHKLCGAQIAPEHKPRMNLRGAWLAEGERIVKDGEVSGDARKAQIASYWLGGVAAAFQVWDKMVDKYLSAVEQWARSGELTLLRQTINTDQGAPFCAPTGGQSQDATTLQSSAETWERETVPAGVRFLLGTADIQKGRFVVQVFGIGPGTGDAPFDWWLVDRYTLRVSRRENERGEPLPLNPAVFAEDWARLTDKLVKRRYPLGDGSGREMPIIRSAVDSGGEEGVTEKAYGWWRGLSAAGLGWQVRLVKGASTKDAPRVREAMPDTKDRKDRGASAGDVPVLMINTNTLKDGVHADLERCIKRSGGAHLPAWLPAEVFAEMTAETRTAHGWVNPAGSRNEAFDLSTYKRALCVQFEVDRPGWWEKPPMWALPWDKNPSLTTATAGAETVKRRSLADIARELNG